MKASEFLKKGIKRKLIASLCMDSETATRVADVPLITWWFDFQKMDAPVQIVLTTVYGVYEKRVAFSTECRQVISREKNLIQFSKNLLLDMIPQYDGNKQVNHFYKTEFGHDLPLSIIDP